MIKYCHLRLLFTIVFFFATYFTEAQTSFGKATLINNDWLFRLKDEANAYNPDFNDKGWRRLDLPHDWSIEGTLSPSLASCTGYLPGGIAWYRKRLADDEVTCTITGTARLLGLESANNTDMTNYRDNTQRVYNGRMMAYLQTTGDTGKVNVVFSAPWLNPGKVSLTVK